MVFDFDRRERPVTRSVATPLVGTLRSPFFITLDAQRAQATPKLALARPWLRAPATVYCGSETTFRIEIDAPTDLRRSYLQVILAPDAPVQSSFSARALRAKVGDTLSFDVKLKRTSDELFEPTELVVRLRLEGTSLRFPVTLRPLVHVRPLNSAAKITDGDFAVGHLTPPSPDEEEAAQLGATLHAGYQSRNLHVAITLPPDAAANAILQLGIAVENADTHAEVRIENLTHRPELTPAYGTTGSQMAGWRCRTLEGKGAAARFCHVSIPAGSLGLSAFQPGTRLLLAARYVQPRPGSHALPLVSEWGSGLGGAQSTGSYHWTYLEPPPTDK